MEVYKSDIITLQLNTEELTQLESEFTLYKSNNDIPVRFGRDVPYDHPNTLPILKIEEVQHLHLADSNTHWKKSQLQYYKTSDTHLVYCQGVIEESYYLLMAVLRPNAHEQARNNQVMHNLGMIAEKFRLQF